MEYKYEQIFGDQSLFDGAPEDAEAVGGGKPLQDALVFYKFSDGEFQYKYEAEIDDWKVSTCNHPQSVIKAMRRIIKEPKRWTWEDKKAGRLPEVGSIFTYRDETLTCHFIDGDGEIWAHDIDNKIVTPLLRDCQPIETPAEKAQRFESEWVESAFDAVMIVGVHSTEDIQRIKNHLRTIYRAQLSGDLAAPKGGE